MAKYVRVTEAPETLDKDEYVVRTPDFVQDVAECPRVLPSNGLMTASYLRGFADYLGYKHDDLFPGSGFMSVQEYDGVPFEGKEGAAKIAMKLFRKYYPQIIDAMIDRQLKNRPFGTKLVYFVGDHHNSTPFTKNGIDAIDQSEVDVYMGRKERKLPKSAIK